jgi:hypothetical protein
MVLAVAAVAVAALGGTALAGHNASDVKSYTGCLVSGDGVIIKVKEGDAPKSPCMGGQTQVHLSAGDITKISVTGALSGGGENGEVTIGLKPEFTLPTGCSSGQVAKWNGTGWACAADNDTTYAAGTGLDLTGTTFSIESDYRVKNTPDCSGNQFAKGFDSDGAIQCGTPTAPSLQTFQARQTNYVAGDGVPDDGEFRPYVTLAVPAGTYLVIGKGRLHQGDDDQGFTMVPGISCRIGNLPVEFFNTHGKDNAPDDYGFALTGVVATSGDALTLECSAADDLDLVDFRNGTLVALKVG